jgi:CRISPR system Cascade subunit CasD
MATLLLRLVGPMQSWGTQSHFNHRDTGLEPSKSGVIGLICAAMGRDRTKSIDDLAALRMGVRVDREGLVKRDYHTAGKGGFLRAKGEIEDKDLIVSQRFYLADAAFLVGLQSDDLDLLKVIDKRLSRPVWMLFLGRKSFVASEPVWLKDTGLHPALTLEQTLVDPEHRHRRIARQQVGFDLNLARVVIEDEKHGSIVRNDQPITYDRRDSMTQHCTVRRVQVMWQALPEDGGK